MKFLDVVWDDREGYVDIPSKVNGRWVPCTLEWPEDREAILERVKQCVRDEEDVYFSVAQFSNGRRDADACMSSHWLWADLDTTTPQRCEELGFPPTLAWQSSPDKYQALWRLTKELSPNILEDLNRRMTYAVGADLSGWDLTQVLRIPGTRNFKYDGGPKVKMLGYNRDEVYQPKALHRRFMEMGLAQIDMASLVRSAPAVVGDGSIPGRAMLLLNTKPEMVVEGERSARLWELECILAESGHDEDQIYELVSVSAWNKWQHVRTGEVRLRQDIRKALRHVGLKLMAEVAKRDAENGQVKLQVVESSVVYPTTDLTQLGNKYPRFMAGTDSEVSWLVNEIWTSSSHGIIGGEPKTSKSTLATALAMSVASGRPFLGEYEVLGGGPVFIIQEENAAWIMRDRMKKMAYSYGLIRDQDYEVRKSPKGSLLKHEIHVLDFPDDVPLTVWNNYGFNLSEEQHREDLENEIARDRPVMVVLDPLYLMLGDADENSSSSLRPYLQWLLYLRYTYNCAIVLVHHYRKATRDGRVGRPGQQLMGSGTLHGWIESAMYCEVVDPMGDHNIAVKVEREFRNVEPRKPIEIQMKMGEPGTLVFEADMSLYSLTTEIVDLVGSQPGITVVGIAAELGADKRTVLNKVKNTTLQLVGGTRGRGHSWRVYPEGYDLNADGSKGEESDG